MSIVRNVVRLVVRDMARSVTGDDQVRRYFTDYSASLNSYDEFSSDVVLDADFTIRVKVSTVALATLTILGREDGSDYLILRADGSIRIRIDSVNYETSTAIVAANRLAEIEVSRVGSDLSISYNNSAPETFAGATGTFTTNRTAQFANTFYFNGPIADLEIEKAGTLVVDMPLDEPPEATERINRADPLNNATRFNQPASQTELYTLFTDVSPNEWRNADNTKILPVAGT